MHSVFIQSLVIADDLSRTLEYDSLTNHDVNDFIAKIDAHNKSLIVVMLSDIDGAEIKSAPVRIVSLFY